MVHIAKPELKKAWVPTPRALRQFLSWLDEGVDSSGETYLEMRRRLVRYFDRKRCLAPDELADETLNRVARRLEEESAIADAPPARYCYSVAKFVFLESLRRTEHLPIPDSLTSPESDSGSDAKERLLSCLDRCLEKLAPEERVLILDYYRGDERPTIKQRRALSARLGVSANALSIRACRIRDKLETCVNACSTSR
jgi:DNA-directed RNA polymerase specialized sigma24 family protein